MIRACSAMANFMAFEAIANEIERIQNDLQIEMGRHKGALDIYGKGTK